MAKNKTPLTRAREAAANAAHDLGSVRRALAEGRFTDAQESAALAVDAAIEAGAASTAAQKISGQWSAAARAVCAVYAAEAKADAEAANADVLFAVAEKSRERARLAQLAAEAAEADAAEDRRYAQDSARIAARVRGEADTARAKAEVFRAPVKAALADRI